MADSGSKAEYYVGVDVGGTKILAGVFDAALQCLATAKVSTKAQRGADAVIERIARACNEAVDEADLKLEQVRAVGVGAPGAVDSSAGEVIFAPNLDWRDVPLRKALEKELKVPVAVENDCNLATLGVHVAELKAKPRHLLGVFIGTGIGGGIVINGELYRGFSFTAAEIGHMVIDVEGPKCNCGNRGCWEALASRTAITQQIRTALKNGQKSLLTEMLDGDLDALRSGDLRKALRKGDKLVDRVITDAAEYTGVALGNLANILNPEVIVLGGGLIEALGDDMLGVIVETAQDYVMPGVLKGVEILASRLGDNAGITGGAVLARKVAK